jgi:hypothetical protein
MTTGTKLNGHWKWIALFLPLTLGAIGGFYHLKGTVRVVESDVAGLEKAVERQYQDIQADLSEIKADIRVLLTR